MFQIFLGITTLLLMAPEWLAAAHQVTAALLLCAAVWHAYEVRVYPQTLGVIPGEPRDRAR